MPSPLPPPLAPDAVVLVTGASHGIGRALVERLLRGGRVGGVAGLARDASTLPAHPRALWLEADVSDPLTVGRAVRRVRSHFHRLDALVNGAAVCETTPLDAPSARGWEHTLAVNLLGPLYVVRAALPWLRHSPTPRIVNVLSGEAYQCSPLIGAYVASKAGLAALTRSMARELGPDGILVLGVSPGSVDTRLNPGGARTPDEAAADLERALLDPRCPSGVFLVGGEVGVTQVWDESAAAPFAAVPPPLDA